AKKGVALVFGRGENPISFVSVRDVAALVALALGDETLRGATVEIGGVENLGFVTVAAGVIETRGRAGARQKIPLPVLRVMSLLARPFSPLFARQAQAAVMMNTTDMTFADSLRARFPSLPSTTLRDVLAQGAG